jgi:hypothetical protein
MNKRFEAILHCVMQANSEMGCDVSIKDIVSSTRKNKVVRVRHISSLIAKEQGFISYPKIAKRLSKDHSSVLYSVKKCRWLILNDPIYGNLYARSMQLLGLPVKEGVCQQMPVIPYDYDNHLCDRPIRLGNGFYVIPRPWRGDDPQHKPMNKTSAPKKAKKPRRPVGPTGIEPVVLRQYFKCLPSTGRLIWKERGPDMFAKEGLHTVWNNRFAGKEAGCMFRGVKMVRIKNKLHPASQIIKEMTA